MNQPPAPVVDGSGVETPAPEDVPDEAATDVIHALQQTRVKGRKVQVRRDRGFEDGLARKSLIDAFRVIEDDALVASYRRKMSSLLLA